MRATNEQSSERLQEEEGGFWSPYKLDVERIIHSKSFCRYTDKTQVVYLVENDHLTHRGLHVQFVSSFARGLAEQLDLNMHLVEAIALGHDVGHPPFGHEGEGYLSELSREVGLGAFSHAHQSCRLFRDIEPLNLTLATFDGFLCHDGGMRGKKCVPRFDKSFEHHFQECKERTEEPEKDFRPKTMEGALVKMCDTISYIGKDIEDAIGLGIIDRKALPKTILGSTNGEILAAAGFDLIQQSKDQEYIELSQEAFDALKTLRQFNFEHIYRHPSLKVESEKIRTSYRYLYEKLLEDFEKKDTDSYLWKNFLHSRTKEYLEGTVKAQKVIDFIAGMTDSYFILTLQKLFIPQPIRI